MLAIPALICRKYIEKLNVGGAVGTEGFLEVIRDMRLRSPFIGRVPLQSGEIAEDLAYYFTLSEQIPSLVSLGVLIAPGGKVEGAGGLFVQAMPGAGDELLRVLEERVLEAGPISSLVKWDLVRLVGHYGDIPLSWTREVYFRCCSRQGVNCNGSQHEDIHSPGILGCLKSLQLLR